MHRSRRMRVDLELCFLPEMAGDVLMENAIFFLWHFGVDETLNREYAVEHI